MSFDLKHSKMNLGVDEQANSDQNRQSEDQHEDGNVGRVLHQWRAPEFEVYEKSARWYLVFALFIVGMVVYALFTNGPIMAITFILIGIVGYIHLQKDPRVISFSITSKGVTADKEMYL